MEVYYGVEGKYSNITNTVLEKCLINDILTIPKTDLARSIIFGDPLQGILKHIKIGDSIYSHEDLICINYITGEAIDVSIVRKKWWNEKGKFILDDEIRLRNLHNLIKLSFGSFQDEFPEQLMAIKYILETDTVLEIGANIGRNTCIIASILKDDTRLISLECCQEYAKQLEINKNQNNFNFHIEASALSKVPLIQQGWNTFVSEIVPSGYTKINTITFNELETKYNTKFNVLVADCEGALYQILKDEPDFLKNIETVIIENDFYELEKKQFVDLKFKENNLNIIYSQSGGWGPCQQFFFQVFSKR
jgi:FkbM family methyltransferase